MSDTLDIELRPRAALGECCSLETSLYLPVKNFLEKLGFIVKGEIGGCDLVALTATSRRSSWSAS